MKKVNNIIILFSCLSTFSLKAQEKNRAEMQIKWTGYNVTLVKDLGMVWIILKNGDKIKKANIWEIQKEKGRITYEKEGSLHDVEMAKIKNIVPGNNPRQLLFFDGNNIPKIMENDEFNPMETSSQFKVTYQEEFPGTVISPTASPQSDKKEEANLQEQKPTDHIQDTIIRKGVAFPAKVIEIGDYEFKYKRADVPDGPLYTVKRSAGTELKRYNDHVTIIIREN